MQWSNGEFLLFTIFLRDLTHNFFESHHIFFSFTVKVSLPLPYLIMSTRKRRQAESSLSASVSTSSGIAVPVSEEPVVETQSIRNNNVLHHLSDYETERLNNIKRNEEFLASLGISEVKSSMASTAAANKPAVKKKVVRVKTTPTNVNVPVRRSGRVTIDKLQEEIAVLENSSVGEDKQVLESKKKELEEMIQRKYDRTSFEVVVNDSEANRWQRLSTDPILLTSMLYSEDDYEKEAVEKDLNDLVSCMKSHFHDHDSKNNIHTNNKDKKRKGTVISTEEDTTKGAKESVCLQEYKQRLSTLSLADTDVAKLVQDRVTAVYVHPSEVKTIVIAGDKSGHVGVWDVDKSGTSSVDGVYKYRPHISNIAKICCSSVGTSSSSSSAAAAVYTTSYDGTIRHLDLNHDAFTTAFAAPEDLEAMYFTDASFCYDHSECVYVSTSDGCIAFIDLRASNSVYQSRCSAFSGYKLNSIQQHPTMSHLLITSERSGIYIYDNRYQSSSNGKSLKPFNTLALHSKSINAAYTSCDGHSLVSVSQDNTIRSWTNFIDPTTDSHSTVIRHDNITGRWLSTFRPTFDPKSPSTFIVGSMLQPRRVDVFHVSSSPSSSSTSTSDTMTTTSTKRSKSSTTPSLNDTTIKIQIQSIDMIHTLSSEFLNSVCSRNAFHNTKHIIACGNSSGRIHVFR